MRIVRIYKRRMTESQNVVEAVYSWGGGQCYGDIRGRTAGYNLSVRSIQCMRRMGRLCSSYTHAGAHVVGEISPSGIRIDSCKKVTPIGAVPVPSPEFLGTNEMTDKPTSRMYGGHMVM